MLVEKCGNCYNKNIRGGKSTQNETTSPKSFGESVTSVLCAIYFGGVEFYDSVYDFYHIIYCGYVFPWR